MLWRLLRTYLRPFREPLAAVVGLQLLATIATLYLPSINGDIIDRGVATGDTGYVLAHGGVMLAIAGAARSRARSPRSTSARASRWAYGRDLRGGDLPPRRPVVGARGRQVRRAVADHAHDQRRAAGPDARADERDDARDGADHVRRRHRDGAARGPRRCRACCSSCIPVLAGSDRPHHQPDDPEVPRDAAEDRHGQPRAARADHRHARRARVRARAGRGRRASTARTAS